jgi:transcription initiation factor TFIID subunit 5
LVLSGSLDCSVKLWDFQRLAKEIALEDVNVTHNPDIKRGDNQGGYMLRTYATKSTPVLNLHYTRRNVLLAVGVFEANG